MENGNKSANSAYQTWRQFSGSPLKKYEGHNNKELGLSTKFITPAQSQWVKDLASTSKHLINTKKMMNEDADKEAQRIFGSMSLDEFTQRYRDGELPSQDNPLVMSRMKKLYGQTVAGIAHTDFINRISSNEFNDKTPEEVDKLYYEHLQESYNEFKDAFGFTNGEDSDYNNGFWDSGYKGRLITLEAHQKANDKFNKDLSTVTEKSNIAGIASQGNLDDSFQALSTAIETGGLVSPSDMVEGAKTLALSVATSDYAFDKDGSFRLDSIKDKKIPYLNKTLYEVVGPTVWELYRDKAYQQQAERNYDAYAKTAQWAEKQILGLNPEAIKGRLDEELIKSGGRETPVTKMLNGAYLRGLRAINSERAKANGARVSAENMGLAHEYINNALGGKKIPPLTVTGLKREDFDNAFNYTLNNLGSEEERLQYALFVLNTGSNLPYNPAETYLKNSLNEGLSVINNDADILRMSPDSFDKADWNPKVKDLVIAYGENPSAVGGLFGDKAKREQVQVLAHLYRAGVSYKTVVAGIEAKNELQKTHEGRKKLQDLDVNTRTKLASDPELDNPYTYDSVTSLALANIGLNPKKDISTAIGEAKAIFERNHFEFHGAYIPKSFLMFDINDSLGITSNEANLVLEDLYKNLKVPEDDENVQLFFTPRDGGSILIYNQASQAKFGVINKKHLTKWFNDNKPRLEKVIKDTQDKIIIRDKFMSTLNLEENEYGADN